MVVRDGRGMIASVLYGPDRRTRILPDTSAVLFGAWCPGGVPAAAVEAHFTGLARLIRRQWPDAVIATPAVLEATRV